MTPLATGARVVLSCVLAFTVTACEKVETAAQRSVPKPPTPVREMPAYARTVTLEFDAPANYSSKDASGKFAVSGFQVGFFAGTRIVRAIELPRDDVRVEGSKVRLTIPLAPVARPDESSVSVKVRPLAAGALGEWSPSAGSVSLPVLERVDKRAAGGGGNRRDRKDARRGKDRQLTLADVEAHEALNAALMKVLNGASADEAVGSFAKVQDLATAILLTQKLRLPFADLCKAVQASPRRALADGLRAVQPSMDIAAEIKSVAPDAKRLVGRQRR